MKRRRPVWDPWAQHSPHRVDQVEERTSTRRGTTERPAGSGCAVRGLRASRKGAADAARRGRCRHEARPGCSARRRGDHSGGGLRPPTGGAHQGGRGGGDVTTRTTLDPLWYKDAVIYETARQGVLRRQRRRHRRLPGPDGEARLPGDARRHLPLAPAVLPVAAARRRLRHRRLPRRPPQLRDAGRLPPAPGGGPPARHRGAGRAGGQPHLGPAPLVPAGAPRAARVARARLLRLERHRPEVRGDPHHLHRHRAVELDLGRGGQGLLLAPLLQPPARSNFDNPRGRRGDRGGDALLARPGRGRLPPGRHPLPGGARRHVLREPPRDPRRHPAPARLHRPPRARVPAAGRGQPVAGGRAPLLRRRRRVPHGVPLPGHAAHLHGAAPGERRAHRRHHAADARHPARPASGRSSCATTTS